MKSRTNREAVIRENDLQQLQMLAELKAKAELLREAADVILLNVMDYDSFYEDEEIVNWARTLETANDGYDLIMKKIRDCAAVSLCWTENEENQETPCGGKGKKA